MYIYIYIYIYIYVCVCVYVCIHVKIVLNVINVFQVMVISTLMSTLPYTRPWASQRKARGRPSEDFHRYDPLHIYSVGKKQRKLGDITVH